MKEELADYAHRAWSGWMKYLFLNCRPHTKFSNGTFLETESLVIPAEFVKRWKRQMATDYKNLPESEKESDRKEANEMMNIFRKYYEAQAKAKKD